MQRGEDRSRRLRLGVTSLVAWLVLTPRDAPGTVAEQRARLPPPATCESSVEGRWKAHQFDPRFSVWHEFTLEVRHTADSETDLHGDIKVQVWKGGPDDQQPGPCKGELHYRLSMTAKGTHVGEQIRFWGTRSQVDEVVCGGFGGYNLDHFSGTIDAAIQEFQSVNNDGGNAVNQPTVFRRIGCFDDDAAPPTQVDVRLPALFPERGSNAGCSCSQVGAPS